MQDAPECLMTLADGSNRKRSDFPRQVPGRGVTPQPGLFVRPPVLAQITVCHAAFDEAGTADAIACAPGATDLVKDDKVLVPQLGQLRFFRLVNEMFSNDAMSLSLTKDGGIEKFQYGSTKSIAKSLADAAVQGADFAKKRNDEYAANTDPASLALKQIALKEATDKLAALYADPVPDPMTLIASAKAEAEVELLRAQINSLNAKTAAEIASGA